MIVKEGLKQNISAHKNALITSQRFWDYPFKSRVNGFLKINIQEFIFHYRVFTKSIISHPYLKYFYLNNSIYKITHSYGMKQEICRRMPRNSFSSTQFQRKRKSLVFFQSINFLWINYCDCPDFLLHELTHFLRHSSWLIYWPHSRRIWPSTRPRHNLKEKHFAFLSSE